MKLYGANKHQKRKCEWGCCGGELHKIKGLPQGSKLKAIKKAARKRARAQGQQATEQE